MSILTTVQRNEVGSMNPESIHSVTLVITEHSSLRGFRKILHRALNTWPECPAEWKEVADMIEHGKILQDYQDDLPPART